MYSSRCRYLVTILVIMIHTVSTSLKYYSASSFIWRWYESYDYCETPCSAAPMPSMPAWQVRALCAWPGSAQVDPSPCLRLQCFFFGFQKVSFFLGLEKCMKFSAYLCSGAALMGSRSSSFVASVATGEAGCRVVGTGESPRGNCPANFPEKREINRKQV